VVGLIVRRPKNRVVWGLVGARRALREGVIIAGSVSDEEAKGLLGQWKAASVPKVGRPDSNRVEPPFL
jgi:hypothetical protein